MKRYRLLFKCFTVKKRTKHNLTCVLLIESKKTQDEKKAINCVDKANEKKKYTHKWYASHLPAIDIVWWCYCIKRFLFVFGAAVHCNFEKRNAEIRLETGYSNVALQPMITTQFINRFTCISFLSVHLFYFSFMVTLNLKHAAFYGVYAFQKKKTPTKMLMRPNITNVHLNASKFFERDVFFFSLYLHWR